MHQFISRCSNNSIEFIKFWSFCQNFLVINKSGISWHFIVDTSSSKVGLIILEKLIWLILSNLKFFSFILMKFLQSIKIRINVLLIYSKTTYLRVKTIHIERGDYCSIVNLIIQFRVNTIF